MCQVIGRAVVTCLLTAIFAISASAFSGPGHMIIAAIAFQDLTPEQRQQAVAILSSHPEFPRWVQIADSGPMDHGLVAFMGAAKWPDEIKRTSNPWNHEPWHYVDYPVSPPDFVFGASPYPDNDIIKGLTSAIEGLKSKATSSEDKAAWLCLLMHFMGDLHQPLHCCALVNEQFPAPDGDRGGNSIFVRANELAKGVPLHTMWDVSLGNSQGFHAKYLRGYANGAIALRAEFARDKISALSQNTDVLKWAKEGWQIAVEDVYLRGKLQYGVSPIGAPVLPEGYTKRLKAVATQQAAIAGYRLADLIRECLFHGK